MRHVTQNQTPIQNLIEFSFSLAIYIYIYIQINHNNKDSKKWSSMYIQCHCHIFLVFIAITSNNHICSLPRKLQLASLLINGSLILSLKKKKLLCSMIYCAQHETQAYVASTPRATLQAMVNSQAIFIYLLYTYYVPSYI